MRQDEVEPEIVTEENESVVTTKKISFKLDREKFAESQKAEMNQSTGARKVRSIANKMHLYNSMKS